MGTNGGLLAVGAQMGARALLAVGARIEARGLVWHRCPDGSEGPVGRWCLGESQGSLSGVGVCPPALRWVLQCSRPEPAAVHPVQAVSDTLRRHRHFTQ